MSRLLNPSGISSHYRSNFHPEFVVMVESSGISRNSRDKNIFDTNFDTTEDFQVLKSFRNSIDIYKL